MSEVTPLSLSLSLSLSLRRFLPLLRHQPEAGLSLRALPAAEPAPRGALRPIAALPARQLRPRRRGGVGGRRHDLRPCARSLLLHHWLQDRARQNKPLPVRGKDSHQLPSGGGGGIELAEVP